MRQLETTMLTSFAVDKPNLEEITLSLFANTKKKINSATLYHKKVEKEYQVEKRKQKKQRKWNLWFYKNF